VAGTTGGGGVSVITRGAQAVSTSMTAKRMFLISFFSFRHSACLIYNTVRASAERRKDSLIFFTGRPYQAGGWWCGKMRKL
jgi:hypothetical protein